MATNQNQRRNDLIGPGQQYGDEKRERAAQRQQGGRSDEEEE